MEMFFSRRDAEIAELGLYAVFFSRKRGDRRAGFIVCWIRSRRDAENAEAGCVEIQLN